MKEQVTKFVFKTFVLLGRSQKFSSGLKRVNMVNSVAIWVYLNVFHQVYQRATLGTRGFFSHALGRFVLSTAGRHGFGQRLKIRAAKPREKTSGGERLDLPC